MKHLLICTLLGLACSTPAYANGWSLLGNSLNNWSSYSYGMVPSSNIRVYNTGGSGYYYPNAYNYGNGGVNVYARPHVHGCNSPYCYGNYGNYGGYGGYMPRYSSTTVRY